MGAGVVAVALAVSACTSAPSSVAPTTSVTLGAAPVAETSDALLRYGLSSSPADPWAHYRTSCDTSCGIVFGAITDTLFATATSGETVGLLVERFESNPDHTVHTWRLRDGIDFSDGTPFDAVAAKTNIDACRHSALTGPGLAGIDDVRAEGHTLTITTLAPWAALPVHFAETPCGHMFSARWLRSLADLPMRTEGAPFFDPVIAGLPAEGEPTEPVGLGPFVMRSFTPGNGNSTRLERNTGYWRGPSGITGETLPRSADVELVVVTDPEVRQAALDAGQLDVVHARRGVDAADEGVVASSEAFADVLHVALNVATDDHPLHLLSCRRALSRSIDRVALAATFGGAPSDGPFGGLVADVGGQPAPDTGSATEPVDLDAAARWGDRCVDEHGSNVALRLSAAMGDARADVVVDMLVEALGSLPGGGRFDVMIERRSSAELGVAALLGDYDLLLWEGFAGTHPDLHFRWWFSEAAAPIGLVATNVSRIADPMLDDALVDLRRSGELAASQNAAADIRQAFEANAWTVWLTAAVWDVHASVDLDLSRATPEGVELVPMVNGVHTLQQLSNA